MFIKSIKLKNFRNYSSLHSSFGRDANLLLGENGQGKTNLLEALYMLGLIKSFRGVQDRDIMSTGGDSYYLMGVFEDNGLENTISIGYHQGKKQIHLNGTAIKKMSSLIGTLQLAALTQNDIQLIHGSPSVRRRYMDVALSLTFPQYLDSFQTYQRALRQRNKALKDSQNADSKRDLHKIWDEQLIESGTEIIKYRKMFFDPINELCQKLYNQLSYDISDFHLSYRSNIGDLKESSEVKDQLKKKLQDSYPRELQYKQTLYGPHKDDFLIRTGKIDFKRFASQGQSRAGALVLSLSMCGYVESVKGKKMILLLDDVLEDLDIKKKNKFLELVAGRQNFFSATSLEGYEPVIPGAEIFHVADGEISPESPEMT